MPQSGLYFATCVQRLRGLKQALRAKSPRPQGESGAHRILLAGRSLQKRIVLFNSLIVLATSLMAGAVFLAQRQSALERARFDAANLSAAFEEQVGHAITNVAAAMEALKVEIQNKGPQTALGDWAHGTLALSIPAQLTVIGPDGQVAASTLAVDLKGADLSGGQYFRAFKDEKQRGLFIGRPVSGLVPRQVVVPVSSGLETPGGAFAGVLLATLDGSLLTGLYRNVDLGKTGSLTLLGTDGIVRGYSSRRGNEGVVGALRSDIQALRDSAFDPEGAYERKSPIDGDVRLYHWRKVKGYPLIVIVGLGKSEALMAANSQGAMVLALGGVALLLAFSMPFMLYREISRRIAHEIDLSEEKAKLEAANQALAEERKNLRATNEKLNEARCIAEEGSSAKSNFLMNMSHEFRTPMHAILNYTSMGLKKIDSEDLEKIKKYMENTRSAGLRLLGLLNGLLDLAKLEAGKIELQTAKADLMDLLRNTQTEIGSLLEEKRLRVAIDVRANGTNAVVDAGRMMQVLVNLFSNAIKFAPPRSVINVEISDCDLASGRPGLRCSVSDEGVGIPEPELATIFDRFNQSSATKKFGGGAGLGLTICRELVELHGGQIWAENRKEGGATFSFAIPKTDVSPPAGEAGAAKKTPSGPIPTFASV